MKKCPGCGALNQDSSQSCGVCLHDLSGAFPGNIEGLAVALHPRRRWYRKLSLSTVGFLVAGPTLLVAGLVSLSAGNFLLTFILMISGFFSILALVGGDSGGMRGRRALGGGRGGGSASRAESISEDPLQQNLVLVEREREIELEEQRVLKDKKR